MTANRQRINRDCCLNFLKNGFKRTDTLSSSRKETMEENTFNANANKEAEIDAYIKEL